MGPPSRHFAYISDATSLNGDPCLSQEKQGQIIRRHPAASYLTYIFSENDAPAQYIQSTKKRAANNEGESCICQEGEDAGRRAFHIMLTRLQAGDVVMVWSIWNFIERNRLNSASLDVLNRIALIQSRGASVFFVKNNCSTSLAAGRFSIQTLLAAEQYSYDTEKEQSEKYQKAENPEVVISLSAYVTGC